nr:hypothetical protein [Pandoravirus massiliensis]
MTETSADDSLALQEHRDKYKGVINTLNRIRWHIDKPHLREASAASVRTIGDGVLLARRPSEAYLEAPADAGLVTQYNLVLPCATAKVAKPVRLYTDIIVARSNRMFLERASPNWVLYSGMTQQESHRTEDAFGTALDPQAMFCGVAPSLRVSCDSGGWEHHMVLSSGVKTRYAPLDEAKTRMKQETAEARCDQEQ